MGPTAFIDPATGQPLPFADAVTSGLSVGVPGTPATWVQALSRWGTRSLAQMLQPAIQVADRGFTVDETFAQQTQDNAARFGHFRSTAALFLPDGRPPVVGSTLRNPDLAQTYRQIAGHGIDWLYRGQASLPARSSTQRGAHHRSPVINTVLVQVCWQQPIWAPTGSFSGLRRTFDTTGWTSTAWGRPHQGAQRLARR
jgi:gamma-glutamyltranspeptidase/glutathione hydrolase